MHDPLTGLLTRGAFFELWHRVRPSQAQRGDVTLFMTDIDHFGRSTIATVTWAATKHCARWPPPPRHLPPGRRGRYGGEEFVVLAVGCATPDAVQLAERFRGCRGDAFQVGATTTPITASMGVATGNGQTAETLLMPDEALYCAKKAGRNRVVAGARTRPRTPGAG